MSSILALAPPPAGAGGPGGAGQGAGNGEVGSAGKAGGRDRSYAIDKQIEEDSRKFKKECKILLLGE